MTKAKKKSSTTTTRIPSQGLTRVPPGGRGVEWHKGTFGTALKKRKKKKSR